MSESDHKVCTFYATGSTPSFQPIFICHTCKDQKNHEKEGHTNSNPLCICQACADLCHEARGHSVAYVGIGPSYCDCPNFVTKDTVEPCNMCALQEISKKTAADLGISSPSGGAASGLINITMPLKTNIHEENKIEVGMYKKLEEQGIYDFPFHYGAFVIPLIRENPLFCNSLIEEAMELIRHTSDTHWISASQQHSPCSNSFCKLECLALDIFNRHVEAYNLQQFVGEGSGAEWWVQVKSIQSDEAIDLHYDKDEELASAFGLGSFPTLSTVTYLSGGDISNDDYGRLEEPSSPTIIFAHTYDMSEEGEMTYYPHDLDPLKVKIPQVLISHPRTGKHLVFDGRLLHGAPAEPLLKESLRHPIVAAKLDSMNGLCLNKRITLLCNIWLTTRPYRVSHLSPSIRSRIQSCSSQPVSIGLDSFVEFMERPVERLTVTKQIDADRFEQIILPFVSEGATWIHHDSDEESMNLVVSMYPPPKASVENDTMVIWYEAGLQPSLEHLENFNGSPREDSDEGSFDNEVDYEDFYV